jgi:hypothetical protein
MKRINRKKNEVWHGDKEKENKRKGKMERTSTNIVLKMSSLLFSCVHLSLFYQEPFSWNLTFQERCVTLTSMNQARLRSDGEWLTVYLMPLNDE